MSDLILQAQDLKICFKLRKKNHLCAVNSLSFTVHEGQRVAIVGESGCRKTTLALSIINLLPAYPAVKIDGRLHYREHDLLAVKEKDLQKIRGNRIAMIFQDPMVSLNPFLKILTQLSEPLLPHKKITKKEAKKQAIDLLALVGMDNAARRIEHYPHEFSAGMRQRVITAMACSPEILIAEVFSHAQHPYTQVLIRSRISLNQEKKRPLYSIMGQPPNLMNLGKGCPFWPRCPHRKDCAHGEHEFPPGKQLNDQHRVFCWLVEAKNGE